MTNIFNKEKYDIKIRGVYLSIDGTYKDFVFKSGDNEISSYELTVLKENTFFNNAIKAKKSSLYIKQEKKIKKDKKEEEIKKVVADDSKPIGGLDASPKD